MELNLHLRYYYGLLEELEKSLYRFLIERVLRHEYSFNVFREEGQMPEPERRDLPTFRTNEDPYDLFYNMVVIVYEYMLFDFPELYYMEGSELELDRERGFAVIKEGSCNYTPEEISEIDKELEKIIHRFDGITDDYELELAVNDFITESYEYDYEHEKEGREFGELFTVVGFLKRGKAVCEAYTDLAQLILQSHGVPCAHIVGDAMGDGKAELHAWLAVKIKGTYYHLDVTFNDVKREESYPPYTYFNLTDDEIRVDHDFKSLYYPGIVCDKRDYNYYYKNGCYFDTLDGVRAHIHSLCEAGRGSGADKYYYFRADPTIYHEEVNDAMLSSLHDVKESDAYAYEGGYYSINIKHV